MPDICPYPLLRKKSKMYIINQQNVDTSGNAFVLTINTALGTGANIDLRTFLPDGETYDFTCDFSDGGSVSYSGTTPSTDSSLNYIFSGGDGIYQLSFSDKVGGFSINNGIDKLKFTSIDQWGNVGFEYMADFFSGCSNLNTIPNEPIPYNVTSLNSAFRDCVNLAWSIPSGWLDNMTLCNNIGLIFFNCPSITGSIPSGLFDNLTGLLNVTQAFLLCSGLTGAIPIDLLRYNIALQEAIGMFDRCTGLTGTIPVDFFRYNVLLNNISAFFNGCTGLSGQIPENIFYYNPLIANYSLVFRNCRNLILPSVMFNLANLSIVTNFLGFMQTGSVSYSFTGTVQDIWNYATSAASLNAFTNQISLTNYYEIPFDWKGMVEVGTLSVNITDYTTQSVGIERTYSGIAEIHWDDNSFTRCVSGNEAIHNYTANGTYQVKLGAANTSATTALIADNSRITGIANLKTGLLTNLSLHNNQLSGILSLSDAPISNVVLVYNNSGLTGITFASSGNSALTLWETYNSILPNIDFSIFPTSDGISMKLDNQGLTATEHDNQLINLYNQGWINGSCEIVAGNAARTSASDTAYNWLVANGWTMT